MLGAVAIAPVAPFLDALPPHRMAAHFEQVRDTYDGWQMFNRHFWQRDLAGFAEFFFRTVLSEPHSSKQIEDAIGWAAQTTAESLIAAELDAERCVRDRAGTEALLRRSTARCWSSGGSEDHCRTRGRWRGRPAERRSRGRARGRRPPAAHPLSR